MNTDAMPAEPGSDARALPPLWIISLLPALGLFASAVHLPSIPAMAADFSVGTGPIQETVTAYLAAMALFCLVVGPMSDRLGRRRVGLSMLFLFLAGSIVAMLAHSVPVLLAGRLLQGMGASGGLVLSRSMVKDALGGRAAAKAAAQVSMAVAIAPMLAPLVGGYVQQRLGWHANFVIVAGLALALFLFACRRLVETLPCRERYASSYRSMAEGYVGLLAMRRFLVHTIPVMCGAVGLFSFQTGAPVLLIGSMHVSPEDYGFYAAMPAAGFMAGTFLTSRFAARVSEKVLIEAGCLLFILSGMLIALLAWQFAPMPWGVALPMLLFGLGNGLLMPVATLGSMSAAPLLVGSAAALVSFLRMGAGSLGSLVITWLPAGSALALGVVVAGAGVVAAASWAWLGKGE
jgi:DHA1 family bicyclomycin/chloramphenicol resistance-like MFS transporter